MFTLDDMRPLNRITSSKVLPVEHSSSVSTSVDVVVSSRFTEMPVTSYKCKARKALDVSVRCSHHDDVCSYQFRPRSSNNKKSNQSLRPPAIGSQSFGTNYSMQFWPGVPVQPGHPYMQPASGAQQYRPMGQPGQFSQLMQQMPARPGLSSQPDQSSQPMPMSYMQPTQYQNPTAGPGVPHPSYLMHTTVAPTGGQLWMSSGNQGPGNVTPVPQPGQQPSTTAPINQASSTGQDTSAADWQGFTAADEASRGTQSPATLTPSALDQPPASASSANGVSSSPAAVIPVNPVGNAPSNVASESSLASPFIPAVGGSSIVSANMHSSPLGKMENSSSHGAPEALDG
nr:hypothetical protein [Tanacetum cinerariifolium]